MDERVVGATGGAGCVEGSGGSRFQRDLLSRLPLAEAVLLLFGHVLDGPSLERVFDGHRGRCYERELGFATLTNLTRDALVRHGGSGRASFERAAEAGTLPVAVNTAYAKLARVPPAVSEALLGHAAGRLSGLFPDGYAAHPVPASLAGAFRVVVLDGKTVKHVARRLKWTRDLRGRLLGGKLCVALDLHDGRAIAMAASENGEANEVPLATPLVGRVRGSGDARPVLWVGDRQFCDLGLPGLFTARPGDAFCVRHSGNVGFHADPARPRREGVTPEGGRYAQEWGWLGSDGDPRRRYVRRVTLYRDNAAGEQDVSLVTDLLDADRYPAADLLAVYRLRWGIENLFQQVTEVFDLRRLIGSSPRATVFQAALCLVLYDMVQVVKAHAAYAAGRDAAAVSTDKLFADVKEELTAWAKAGGDAAPAAAERLLLPPPAPPRLRQRVAALVASAWTDRWLKAVAETKRRTKHFPKTKVPGGRISVTRALLEYGPQGTRRCRQR